MIGSGLRAGGYGTSFKAAEILLEVSGDIRHYRDCCLCTLYRRRNNFCNYLWINPSSLILI